MSILKKLFGRDVESLLKEARKKEQEGDLGSAVMAYERALDQTGEERSGRRRDIQERLEALRDRLADKFIAQAQDYLGGSDLDSTVETLSQALEVCGSDEKRGEVRKRLDAVQLLIADAQVSDPATTMNDEEVYQALSGAWTEQQIDEFDGYGDRFKSAYLQFHRGNVEAAAAAYRELLGEAGEDALYLRLEYGRALYLKARSLADDKEKQEQMRSLQEEAIGAVEEFQEMLPKRKTPEVRVQAWNLLAQIYLDREDYESAEDALVEAQSVIPQEPAVYLNLGRFLFDRDRLDDAVCALEQGEEIMDKFHPNLDLLLLLATAYRKTGKVEAAIARLESIIAYYMRVDRAEWDPAAALPLAEMYEETGKDREACDMYRNLSTGDDSENLARYNYHSARLMKKLGRKREEIRPYILRAKERAADGELKQKIEDLEKEG